MNSKRTGLRINQPLIYLGVVVLVFLCGAIFGLVVLSRWLGLSGPPGTEVTFVTATPGPPSFDLTVTALSGTEPATLACDATPPDWVPYTVQAGNTLSELAARIGISQGRLLRANCLTSPELLAGQVLYLPPPPTPTPCITSPPSNWGVYTVQSGDTLFDLAAAREITSDQVIQVNCLASPDIVEGQQLYLPVLPTPTPCLPSPPLGWNLYLVQAGDTLFSLATGRGVTTAEVMQVNCLTSSELQEGQQLYLPVLPTPTPQPTPIPAPVAQLISPAQPIPGAPVAPFPQPPAPAVPVDSVFSRRGDLPGLSLAPGSPRTPLDPCQARPQGREPGEFWISAPFLLINEMQHGERAYFFACEFTNPPATPPAAPLTAQMNWPDGREQPLNVRFYLPPLQGVAMGNAEGLVVWNAFCNLPLGEYTLIMEDGQAKMARFSFELKETTSARILSAPQAGSTGTTFQVFYCGFEPNTKVTVNLRYQAAQLVAATPVPTVTPTPGGPRCPECPPRLPSPGIYWRHADSWDVLINRFGWAVQALPSSKDDLGVAYLLDTDIDRDGFADAQDIIWLFR